MANPIRILGMDGGNGLATATMLQMLEKVNAHSFLNKVDIFAGTSAGGINSLFFAQRPNPSEALQDIEAFWKDVYQSIFAGIPAEEAARLVAAGLRHDPLAPVFSQEWQKLGGDIAHGLLGLGQAAMGFRSIFLNDVLKQFLTKYFGAKTTLGDLANDNHYVIIVAFQLDNGCTEPDRSWVPKLFTNLPYKPHRKCGVIVHENPDAREKLVDVALRTSAAPLLLPIVQGCDGTGPGFVDGGLAANNPSMIALTAILGTLAHGTANQPPTPPRESLEDILLLSVGTGRNLVGKAQYLDPTFTNGSAPWGYRQWLLDFSNPLLLINAFLQGSNESVAWQCETLMGEKNFHRLNVPVQDESVSMENPATRHAIAKASTWLNTGRWLQAAQTTALPAPLGAVLSEQRASKV
jgi:patatin-like phospholipase/acyl hydrolase